MTTLFRRCSNPFASLTFGSIRRPIRRSRGKRRRGLISLRKVLLSIGEAATNSQRFEWLNGTLKGHVQKPAFDACSEGLRSLNTKNASGWTLVDLQNYSVEIKQNVDPREMIPGKFFNFQYEHLERYPDGSSTSYSQYNSDKLVRKDMCFLSAQNTIIEKVINRSPASCRQIFNALSRMVKLQPAIKEHTLSQKRSEKRSQRSQNTASQPSSYRILCSL